MRFETVGDPGDPDCLFVMGWGNRTTHEPVRWLLDRLVEADWRVHAATLPLHVTDVDAEWVAPVEAYAADLEEFAVLAHSAGGLTAARAALPGATTRTYLSPFWGYPPATSGRLPALLARLPTDLRILPSRVADRRILGRHATDRQLAAIPDRVSPAFLRTTRRAQRTLPAVDEEAVVFCSLSDRVVSTRAIGDRVPAARTVLYDGGHEPFSSRSRETTIERILAVLSDGPAALD